MRTARMKAAARLACSTLAVTTMVGVLAGCGGSSSGHSSGSTASTTAGGASTTASGGSSGSVSTSACGTKPGVKATGTPIRLGTINTHQPGTDFTDISNMAAAYFACVNANGGIHGHPIKYFIETDQTNPAQIAADAHQLIQSDHVLGIVGATDVLECTIDRTYWHKLGIYELDDGIASDCWASPNSATVNMGPRFSSDGAVQYAIAQHVSKIVFDQSNVPGNQYATVGVRAVAAAAHVPVQSMTENVPIQDANSVAIREVDAAGPNGAVVLDFTPPEALVILQAAEKLGLEDHVKLWGCSTPCNTDFLAKALGPKWNHKLFVNAELSPPDSVHTASMRLYGAILKQYGSAVSGGVGSFSQMGFVDAAIAVHALEQINGPYTRASVNKALRAVHDFDTGQLCEPWTYGDYPFHIANNVDYTVTPQDGKMVIAHGCTPISSADPAIATYRKLAAR